MDVKHPPLINCDLGEGVNNEEEIYPLIDSASIACGGHIGDENSIRSSMVLAKKNRVNIGAHPSYPDRKNFGRKSLEIDWDKLEKSLVEQLDLFLTVAQTLQIEIHHIKCHGALYNDAAKSSTLADQLTSLFMTKMPEIPIFVPFQSEMENIVKKKGLSHYVEVFGDRAYDENYRLVSRAETNSLLEDFGSVNEHLESIISESEIRSKSGKKLPVKADTLCFHGDNPGLFDFLPDIRKKFWT